MMKYLFLLSMVTLTAYAALNEVDKQDIYSKSILTNGGFENGKGAGVGKWTASAGTFNITITGSNLLTGKASATWDAAASNDTLSSFAVTIPAGLYGNSGVGFCRVMTPSGTATHKLEVFDGSLTIASQSIVSSTLPLINSVNFIFPSSGTVSLRLLAQADEPSITVDDCHLGPAAGVNISNISQATFVGSAYFATTTNCAGWSRTNTALGAVASDADCPGPTVESNPGPGVIQTTDADLPKITVNNMPPGNYEVWVSVPTLKDATGSIPNFTLNDGTTSSGRGNGGSTASAGDGVTFAGHFTYTTAANHTFEVYSASASGAIAIPNDTNNKSLQFWIYRYPLSYDQAYTPSTVPFLWYGRHGQDCSWSVTTTTIANIGTGDSSCTFSTDVNVNAGTFASTALGTVSLTPGFTWTPPKTGVFEVCGSTIYSASTGMWAAMRLEVNGANTAEAITSGHVSTALNELSTCGAFTISSLGTISVVARYGVNTGTATLNGSATLTPNKTVNWSLKDLSQSIPAPLLVNSVVTPSSGVMNLVSAVATSITSSAIVRQIGNWLSVTSDNAAGDTTFAIAAGTFSATPYCTCTVETGGVGQICNIDSTTALSSTALRTQVVDHSNTGTDAIIHILCMGAK